MTTATEKQREYLLTLINKWERQSWRFLSQVKGEFAMSSGALGRMTRAECSAMIDDITARLQRRDQEPAEAAAEPAPAASGAMTGDDAVGLLGHRVELTTAKTPDGGLVVTIERIEIMGGVPSLIWHKRNGTIGHVAIDQVTSWRRSA